MEDEESTGERREASADAYPLAQVPVLGTSSPHLGVGELDNESQAGDINPGTTEVESAEIILPGREILKGRFLGNVHNGFNKLSRLAMLWTVHRPWPGGANFAFNLYRHSMQLLFLRPR